MSLPTPTIFSPPAADEGAFAMNDHYEKPAVVEDAPLALTTGVVAPSGSS